MKKLALLLAFVMVFAVLTGCGASSDVPATTPDNASQAPADSSTSGGDKVYRIGFTVNDFNDKWVAYILDNVRAWDAEHDEVEVILGNGETDVNVQMAIIEDWITEKLDVICVKPVDVDASRAYGKKANEAGIPYLAIQQRIDEADAYCGSDGVVCGVTQMQAVVDALGGKGKVVYLVGEAGTLVSQEREEGFYKVLEANEGIELVAHEIGNWQRDQAMTIVENWLAAGLEFDAVVAANDEMAIGAILALENAGVNMDDVIVAGIDATPDGLQMMIDGKLDITLYADAVGYARETLDLALKIAKGEPYADVVLKDVLVLPHQAEEFLEKWK